ncbi:hypothetical protein ACU8MP_16460 [Rhizobium leguminosarum]
MQDTSLKLYHHISAVHLHGIHKHGLTVGDVTDFERFEGQIAVWLTDSINPEGHGLSGRGVDKKEFRLTVEVDELDDRLWKYGNWADENLDIKTQMRIHLVDGWNCCSWYLLFGWVPPARIVEVVSMKTGRPVENRGEYCPLSMSARPASYEGRFAWQRQMVRDVRNATKRTLAT